VHGTCIKTTTVHLVISFLYFNGYMSRSVSTIIRPSYRNLGYIQCSLCLKNYRLIQTY